VGLAQAELWCVVVRLTRLGQHQAGRVSLLVSLAWGRWKGIYQAQAGVAEMAQGARGQLPHHRCLLHPSRHHLSD